MYDFSIVSQKIKNYAASKGLCVVYLFAYGSRVYETAEPNSDFDFYMVVKNSETQTDQQYWDLDGFVCNLNIVSETHFKTLLAEHSVGALECINTPDLLSGAYFKKSLINKSLLRAAFSAKSANSWVKAKKKIAQGDDYVGKKSLFHSLRILCFGIQLATTGKIFDFKQANEWWLDILTAPDFDYLNSKYKPIYNQLHSEFKKVAPH